MNLFLKLECLVVSEVKLQTSKISSSLAKDIDGLWALGPNILVHGPGPDGFWPGVYKSDAFYQGIGVALKGGYAWRP